MSKKFVIADWEIEKLIEATLAAKENPEFCFVAGAHTMAEQILTNLEELPAE